MGNPETITEQFAENGVVLSSDDNEYHPMLEIMDIVIGYKPKLNALAKLWPPGFQTFHLLFKNSLNMPYAMLGNDPLIRELFLGIYASSQETGCEFCTATIIGVALRRGTLPSRIVCKAQTPQDAALFKLSKSLARVPADFDYETMEELQKHFTSENIEWIALAVGLSGFLNLLTKVMGMEVSKTVMDVATPILDRTTKQEQKDNEEQKSDGTISTSDEGDEDDDIDKGSIPQPEKMSTLLRMAKYGPHCVYVETMWVAGVPSSWPSAGKYLKKRIGYSFPLLKKMTHQRARLSYTTIIRDNLDSKTSVIGLVTKCLCGLVYATFADCPNLIKEAKKLAVICAEREEILIDRKTFDVIISIAKEPVPDTEEKAEALLDRLSSLDGVTSRKAAASIILARAASARPTLMPQAIISNVTSLLTPPELVETILWVALQQCFYRVHYFYCVRDAFDECIRKNDQENSITEETLPTEDKVIAEMVASAENNKAGWFAAFCRRLKGKKKSKMLD